MTTDQALGDRSEAGSEDSIPGAQDSPIVELCDIWMEFPGVVALAGVSLEIPRGQVLALVGENGAGKSTLVSILAGVHAGYRGEVRIDGRRAELGDPNRARAAGIALVEQELSLAPELSVAENILLGAFPRSAVPGFVSRSRLEARARETLEIMEIDLPLRQPVRELSPANAQVVEIAKGLARRSRLLILDEPTSSLTKSETEKLLALIRKLREGGTTILYITHKLNEVLEIADRIVVLRDGCKVAEGPSAQWSEERLIQAMVGRDLSQFYQRSPGKPGEVVLSVDSLGLANVFSSVSFSLRAGEIVGMAGLIGAGRSDVASTLFGLRPATTGVIRLHGEELRITSPKVALAHGIALVPEDRRRDGFVPDLLTRQNISLATLRRVCNGPFIDRQKETVAVDAIARKVNLDWSMLAQPTRTLSGGNKQKSVIAKVLLLSPAVLILDEPTRGIDVGAKAEIYALIHELTLVGMATLLISSEMAELLGVCDRILVMRRGRLVAEFDRSIATEEALMTAAAVGSSAMREEAGVHA